MSRCQMIMYPLADGILIMDCWSANGTFTDQRSEAGTAPEHSKPGSRQPLWFGPNEMFVLGVGPKPERVGKRDRLTLTVYPCKECIVCLDKPRSCRLGCGHYTTCEA